MTFFLVWHEEDVDGDPELLSTLDQFELRRGLRLVGSELPLSTLYYQVKWALPRGSGLLVAPLSDFPKFKLMSAGALAWIRAHPNK